MDLISSGVGIIHRSCVLSFVLRVWGPRLPGVCLCWVGLRWLGCVAGFGVCDSIWCGWQDVLFLVVSLGWAWWWGNILVFWVILSGVMARFLGGGWIAGVMLVCLICWFYWWMGWVVTIVELCWFRCFVVVWDCSEFGVILDFWAGALFPW